MSKPDWISERVTLGTSRGSTIVLHRVSQMGAMPRPDPYRAPVLLAHGTFSNFKTCSGLARHLSAKGYHCWLIDFEGHGMSNRVSDSVNFESLFLTGANAALEFMRDRGCASTHWIGHSGGGLAVLMSLARNPVFVENLKSIVTLGSQACNAAPKLSNRLTLSSLALATRLLGYVPGPGLRLGPENETSEVMLQWFNWNRNASWHGSDDFDYNSALHANSSLKSLPIFSIAGTGDRFIAPADACRKLHDMIQGHDNQWLECGQHTGFSENFTHSRLISSRSASQEIWPRISTWLHEIDNSR